MTPAANDLMVWDASGQWKAQGLVDRITAMLTERFTVPMGEVSYFDTTGATVTIAAQSDGSTNMVAVAPTTTGNFDTEFDNGGANSGRLRYTGATTKMFHAALTWSGLAVLAGDEFVAGCAKNGTVLAASKIINTLTGLTTQGTAIHVMVELATNDYLEFFVGNLTGARNIVIKSMNLFAMGM